LAFEKDGSKGVDVAHTEKCLHGHWCSARICTFSSFPIDQLIELRVISEYWSSEVRFQLIILLVSGNGLFKLWVIYDIGCFTAYRLAQNQRLIRVWQVVYWFHPVWSNPKSNFTLFFGTLIVLSRGDDKALSVFIICSNPSSFHLLHHKITSWPIKSILLSHVSETFCVSTPCTPPQTTKSVLTFLLQKPRS
jgi:hypothetical protein